MYEVGRLVMKIAGRDAGKVGVIVAVDGNKILIDGQVRQRKVNVKHVELLRKKIKLSEKASFEEICKVLKKEGFECRETKKKDSKPKPKKVRKVKKVSKKAKKNAKKPEKKKGEVKPAKKKVDKKEE